MKYKLQWNYKRKGKQPVTFFTDWLDGETALEVGSDIEKTRSAEALDFTDEMGTTWTLKEMKKLLAETEEEPADLLVYFDGGYDKDSGRAGLGAIVYYRQGKKKYRLRANEVIEEMESNNEAEYAAFYFAIGLLEELGVHSMPCEFKGDSQVVLKQLEGEWPCYEECFNNWLDRIEAKLKKLALLPRYIAVPRNENKEADKLAAQALQGKIINSKMQII
ncbi:reverse transcriptase-like protein [Bacillus massilinigeriensis]|uniref:reverse transcriptase-like protein n=1 Tax=Bacillus mediterraneensis TaxID=1805474 RepID=UPI0008F8B90E|nr:reverse transcriptase-like protein [Bacillus mediterraneensis]